MFSQSGYQALPLGDFDRFPQSSNWLNGSSRVFFSSRHSQDQEERGTDSPQGFISWICHGIVTALVFLLTILSFPISGWFVLKIVPMYERIIVFRLGRIQSPKGPGVVFLLPFIDHWQQVDLRTRAFNIPPCKLMTRDGVLVSVGADVQFRIWDPVLSVMMVKDLNVATRMTAQNAMTKILLKKYLREIHTEKLRIGDQLLLEINDTTKSWGLEVDRVELILEAVLQMPQENIRGSQTAIPPIPGLEGLDGVIQQLALHFFGKTLAASATNPNGAFGTGEHVEIQDEVAQPIPTTDAVMSSSSGEKKKLNVEELFLAMEIFLSESLVNQVRASYQINIQLSGGDQSTYFLDLSTVFSQSPYSNIQAACLLCFLSSRLQRKKYEFRHHSRGRIGHGLPENSPDVVLEMAESDLEAFILGELHPLSAYVCGRLRVQGDLNIALKLEELFKVMKQQR